MLVFVIDDDPALCDFLRDFLEEKGYLVITATNGAEALAKLRQLELLPCLLLLDMMMPIMDGWSFRHAQMQDPVLAAIPVVIMSAMQSLPQTATHIGVNGYLAKPFTEQEVLNIVARFCGSCP